MFKASEIEASALKKLEYCAIGKCMGVHCQQSKLKDLNRWVFLSHLIIQSIFCRGNEDLTISDVLKSNQ